VIGSSFSYGGSGELQRKSYVRQGGYHPRPQPLRECGLGTWREDWGGAESLRDPRADWEYVESGK